MTEQLPAEARIRTPDRRLRVFVSSALGEMAEERRAVARAITALRLTPVMFEAGARPHPPTELYRAYLAQSDIFIGLYWQRYGWIGPGMEISGLEDEFERSGVLPRLVYVKAPAPDRESRLVRMLDRIKATGAQAEHEYPVPALSVPTDAPRASVEQIEQSPAVALFVDRARAVRPDFALTARNVRAVAEICRRLEGLPLAIELAAARTRLQEPEALLPRLAVSLDALGAGPRNLPERQRTLRATVDWSIAQLDDDERSFLEVVAVFVDGWTPQAAASVTGLDEDRALELSETLARHSLIYLDLTGSGARLRMLDTVRAFVGERLRARRGNAAIERRHADYYRALVEQADRPLRVAGQHEWTERLRTEAGNLAAAIRWYLDHDRRPLPHLFRVLWPFWEQQDHMGEARAWIERLLADTDELNPEARAEVLWTALVTANEVGDDAGALAACDRLAPLVVGARDHSLQAVSQLAMAWTVPILGDLEQALRGVLQALEQLQHQDEPYWTAVALTTAGNLEMALDRYDDALRRVTQARDLAGLLDNRWLKAWAQVQLGILTVARGPRGQARVVLDEGLDFSLAAGSTSLISFCLVGFAQQALADGDPQQAALAAGAAEGLRQRAGLRAWPMLRRSEAQLLAAIRAAVGTDRFDQLYPAGKRLTQEQAVGVARSWAAPTG